MSLQIWACRMDISILDHTTDESKRVLEDCNYVKLEDDDSHGRLEE